MAVSLSLLAGAGWQFLDDSGNPLTGGLLYTYAAGTTTPQTTYTSSSGATPNANPIVLDAAGRVAEEVWLTVGSNYKFVLKNSAAVTIWTKDNIPGGISSDSVTFLQAGTGAVTRTVQSKLRDTVSVKDFGAVGDGITDDTVAIQAAINYAKSTSAIRCVEFAPGTYKTSSAINIIGDFGSGLLLQGNRATLYGTHSGVVLNCDATGAPATRLNLRVKDLTIIGNGNAASVGAQLYGADYYFENVILSTCGKALYGHGVLISSFIGCTFTNSQYGIYLDDFSLFAPNDVHFYKCDIISNNRAIKYLNFDYGALTFTGCEIEGNNSGGNAADGIAVCEFTGAGEVTFVGTHFEANPGQYNLYYDSPNGRHLNIIGCKIIPGDTTGSCVYVGYGELFVSGSHIAQNIGNNINLSANCGSATIVGNTAGTVTGTLTKLVRIQQGRVTTGGATGTTAGVHAKNTSSGVGLDVEGTQRFVDASNARTGYQTNNSLVLDSSGAYTISTGYGTLYVTRTTTQVEPGNDNTWGLGSAALRWNTVYAGTGTINTSDARTKQQVRTLADAERAVALRVKGLLRAFKFNDAVASKSEKARTHFGVIAQDVMAAFEAEGLDAKRYALFCHDQWDDQAEIRADDGSVLIAAIPAGDRYGIRYEQLLAFIIAAL